MLHGNGWVTPLRDVHGKTYRKLRLRKVNNLNFRKSIGALRNK